MNAHSRSWVESSCQSCTLTQEERLIGSLNFTHTSKDRSMSRSRPNHVVQTTRFSRKKKRKHFSFRQSTNGRHSLSRRGFIFSTGSKILFSPLFSSTVFFSFSLNSAMRLHNRNFARCRGLLWRAGMHPPFRNGAVNEPKTYVLSADLFWRLKLGRNRSTHTLKFSLAASYFWGGRRRRTHADKFHVFDSCGGKTRRNVFFTNNSRLLVFFLLDENRLWLISILRVWVSATK